MAVIFALTAMDKNEAEEAKKATEKTDTSFRDRSE